MSQIYTFKPEIKIHGDNPVDARNNLMRLLAKHELDHKIVRFAIGNAEES